MRRSLCKAADPRDSRDPEWNSLWRDVCGARTAPGATFPTKSEWEWTQGIYGMLRLGRINEEATALGVGSGHEPPVFWLTNHVKQVIATDLYTGDYSYADGRTSADNPTMLTNPEKFAPYPFRRDRLQVRQMDGRALEFPDNSFDIVFSFSSIEHLGGHAESTRMAKEMARVAKPAGLVVLSTEMIVTASWLRRLPFFPVNNTYFWPAQLQSVLLKPAGLQLLDELDTAVREEDISAAPVVGHHTGAPTHCMKVGRYGKTVFTPIIMFATK